MKLKIVAVVLAIVAIGFVAWAFVMRGRHRDTDPLAYDRKLCGNGDPTKGDHLDNCVELAFELMGRANVKVDDDAARAILKRACDHAYDRACAVLREWDRNKEFVAEGRCNAAWFKPADPASCVAAANAYANGLMGPPSFDEADKWYAKACALGLHDACGQRPK